MAKELLSKKDKASSIKRLNILNGQIDGIKKMIDANASCDDVLIQLSSIYHSIKSLSNFIIEQHIENTVVEGLKNGKVEILKDLNNMYKRFQ